MQIEHTLSDSKQIIEDVIKLATKNGASQAEASMSKVQGIAVSSRLNEIENVEFTNDSSLGISVYMGAKKGSASTADLSPVALALAVEKAIHIAQYTGEDPCNGLADEALMAKEFSDLELYHPIELDTQMAMAKVLEAEAAALDYDDKITNSDGATFNGNIGASVYGNSHGLLAGQPSSRYSLSCMVIGSHEDDMQRDYAYTVSRNFDHLSQPKAVSYTHLTLPTIYSV